MLTHLKLDNFKIWRSTGAMRLAPITLLLGTNSSGKSSLIQSLLLIRQTVKGDDPNLDLNLGNPDEGDSVTLGQFKDLLSRHGGESEAIKANQVGVEFKWSESGQPEEATIFSARYRQGPGARWQCRAGLSASWQGWSGLFCGAAQAGHLPLAVGSGASPCGAKPTLSASALLRLCSLCDCLTGHARRTDQRYWPRIAG
ncbi:hypothetical protein [Pseudomonas sp. TE12234]